MEWLPPMQISAHDFFSFSSFLVVALIGGGGAGLDFLCLCLMVPVLLLFVECVEGDLNSDFSC